MTLKQCAAGVMMLAGIAIAKPAQASSLTLYDNYNGQGVTEDASISSVVWNLTIQDDCQQCSVLLTAEFTGSNNHYLGTYLDSVQWTTKGNASPVGVDYNGFYVNDTMQSNWDSSWSFALNQNLNANQCNGNSKTSNAICGEWVAGGTAGGYGAITPNLLLAWTFDTTFSNELSTLTSGNIRGAFNTGTGKNFNIFASNGGTFESGDCSEANGCVSEDVPEDIALIPPIPEPASLLLLGTGLLAIGRQVRKRKNS